VTAATAAKHSTIRQAHAAHDRAASEPKTPQRVLDADENSIGGRTGSWSCRRRGNVASRCELIRQLATK